MRAVIRYALLFALSLAMGAAGVPSEAKILPEEPRCCLLMKQDGCDQQPVKSSEQQQCCASCMSCFALPAAAGTSFVYAPTGEETFAFLSVTAHARAQRPELPPPRCSVV